ncbi:helicase-related protein, partial [Propioniciclava flava]
IELLRDLRLGSYDVLVGINLLREGLDLPEVSLVAILDADKEGFLRSERSLIQTIGRAARNVGGQVHMYADKMTPSMEAAIDETNRRRDKQIAYNTEHGIDPQPLRKKIADITEMLAREDADTRTVVGTFGDKPTSPVPAKKGERDLSALPTSELASLVHELTDQMHAAARELQFETAARLRDEVADLKKTIRQVVEATK